VQRFVLAMLGSRWNSELSDTRHQIEREGEQACGCHTIEEANFRRVFCHGGGVAAWGLDQTRQPQLERLLITTERTRGETSTLRQACVVYPPPYAILLVQWKVKGRDLRPSLAVPSSCG